MIHFLVREILPQLISQIVDLLSNDEVDQQEVSLKGARAELMTDEH